MTNRKFALFGSCPDMMGALGVLQRVCAGSETHDLQYFPTDLSPQGLSVKVRTLTAGKIAAVVGFSDVARYDELSFGIARVATRTGNCVLVLTPHGYRRIYELIGTLSGVDANHLQGCVPAVITVGKDTGTSFVSLDGMFPRAKPFSMGGFGWADSTCLKMAEHIVKATGGEGLAA